MKKIIYSAVLLLIFNTCKAQNTKKMENTFEIPEITKEFEKFDISKINGRGSIYEEKSENEYIIYTSAIIGFGKTIYQDNSYFKILKSFHSNNFYGIRKKGIIFNNGSRYGIWYEFDKEGKRIAAIDTDIGYDYGWDDILAYCRENDIPLTKGYPERGGIKTEIHKDEEGGKKVWTLRYNNNKTFQYLEVTLDGRTGAVLNQRELEFH